MFSNVFQLQWWGSHFSITYGKWLDVTEVLLLTIIISWEAIQNSVVPMLYTQSARQWLSTLNYVISTKTVKSSSFLYVNIIRIKKALSECIWLGMHLSGQRTCLAPCVRSHSSSSITTGEPNKAVLELFTDGQLFSLREWLPGIGKQIQTLLNIKKTVTERKSLCCILSSYGMVKHIIITK